MMKMTLDEYLKKEGISPSAWAKKVGISQPIITRFLSGKRGVSLETALRIQEATAGMVRVEELKSKRTASVAKGTPDFMSSCYE